MNVSHGLTRWRLALFASLILAVVFGLVEGFSIFTLALARDLGIERAAISGMYSIYLLACTAIAPLAGRVIDCLGPRLVIKVSFPILALGLLACSRITALWQLYLVYIGLLAGTATLLILAGQVMVSNHYRERRGMALGIAFSGVGLGDFVFFNILGALVTHAGWRAAYLAAAGIAAMASAVFLASGRALPGKPAVVENEEAGQNTNPSRAVRVGAIARLPAFWFLAGAACAASVIDFAAYQHLVPYLVTEGYTESSAGFVLGLVSLGYTAGQLGAGALSDRVGRETVGAGAAVLCVAGLAALWRLPPAWLVAAAAVLLGLSIGAVLGCRNAALGDLFSGPSLGRVSGLIQVASSLGAAWITWIGSYSFDVTGSYDLTFGLATACAGIWVLMLWSALPHVRVHKKVPIGDRDR